MERYRAAPAAFSEAAFFDTVVFFHLSAFGVPTSAGRADTAPHLPSARARIPGLPAVLSDSGVLENSAGCETHCNCFASSLLYRT